MMVLIMTILYDTRLVHPVMAQDVVPATYVMEKEALNPNVHPAMVPAYVPTVPVAAVRVAAEVPVADPVVDQIAEVLLLILMKKTKDIVNI